MSDEDLLDKMLKDRLYVYYQTEANSKTKEELIDIIISKEMKNLEKDKEIEALKLKNLQLIQNILDMKTECKMFFKQGQDHRKKLNTISIRSYNDDSSNINKKTSFNKKEISISIEDSDEDLKASKSNSVYIRKSIINNLSVDDLMKSIKNFLTEAKEVLISFLKENSSYEDYKSNTNDVGNSPIKLQMKEVQFYLSNLSEIQFYYKTLFVDYSNRLLQILQNFINNINKKLNDLNTKIQNLASHFN